MKFKLDENYYSKSGSLNTGLYEYGINVVSSTSQEFSEDPYVLGNINIETKPISISVDSTALVKKYDATREINLSEKLSLIGVVIPDDVNIDGIGYFNQAEAGNNISYLLSNFELTGNDSGNYSLTSAEIIGSSGEILRQDLIVKVNDQQKVYDGNKVRNFKVSYEGLVFGEDENSLNGELLFTGPGIDQSNIGSFSVNSTGLFSNNYNIQYEEGKLTILPLTVNVIPNVSSKIYGSSDPELGYTLSSSVESLELSVQGALSRASGENAGSYPISLGTLTNTNYILDIKESNFEIIPKQLIVKAKSTTKSYDGLISAEFEVEYDGFVNGENQSVLNGQLLFEGNGVNAVDVGSYTINPLGLLSDNYSIIFEEGIFSITPLQVVLTPNVISKTYGASDPALTYVLTSSSTIPLSVSGLLSREQGENVGSYPIELGTISNTNYLITLVPRDFIISPKRLQVFVENVFKSYDAQVFTNFVTKINRKVFWCV
mgnify:FL=1